MSERKKGNGHDTEDSGNVVRMPTRSERDREKKLQEKVWRREYRKLHHEPFIKLPPITKYSVAAILLVHLAMIFSSPAFQYRIISYFAFIPGVYTGEVPFVWTALISPFTYMLLHGGWIHVIMNGVMLAAFGSGVEKWLGWQKMLPYMIACGLISAAAHFALSPSSTTPVLGASGAISGLFAAAIIMLARSGTLPMGRFGILPLVLIWILISFIFGSMGGPHGESVAWAAHIGGFLGGFALLKLIKVL